MSEKPCGDLNPHTSRSVAADSLPAAKRLTMRRV